MADIYVYGTIGAPGFWDDPADCYQLWQMRNDLDAAAGDDVTLHINSGGGDVFDAAAMSSLITEYRKKYPQCKVTTMLEGLAASAASYVGLTAEEVVIAPSCLMMIHDPSGGCVGQSKDMRKTADLLDKVRDVIAEIYSHKSGKDVADVRSDMADETWLKADEALSYGLVDRIDEGAPRIAARFTKFDAKTWAHAPEALREQEKAPDKASGEPTPTITDEGEPAQAEPEKAEGEAPEAVAEAATEARVIGGSVYVFQTHTSQSEE